MLSAIATANGNSYASSERLIFVAERNLIAGFSADLAADYAKGHAIRLPTAQTSPPAQIWGLLLRATSLVPANQ
jgi:hypothetical protein